MTVIGSRTTGQIVKVNLTTGGSGYTTAPTVSIAAATGTGATAFAVLAGSMVESVIIKGVGSGYVAGATVAFAGGGGSGAAGTVSVHTGSRRYLTFFKGRYKDMYGVDGMGRGIRWNGDDAAVQPIGINPPCVGPGLTVSPTGTSAVKSIQMVNGGAGYNNIPAVVFTGGSPTVEAKARAIIDNGRVSGVTITNPGSGYVATPSVSFTGGMGTAAAFTVNCLGGVQRVRILNGGSGYALGAGSTFVAPSVVFGSTNGCTRIHAQVVVTPKGQIGEIILRSGGTGATASGITASIAAGSGSGSGATLVVDQFFRVDSVSVANSGSGYMAAPVVTVLPATDDLGGGGASVTCSVNTTGNVSAATVLRGGSYSSPPTAVILDTQARATATMALPMSGKYKCCFRYLDNTPEDQGGPIPSSISDIVEVDGAASLTWNLTTTGLDDRVTALELWRTSADQSVILFRVATIQRADFATPYVESLSDAVLADPSRDGYGLMPITLPSGQINARRFEVPPGEFAVACMFQDRAWYGVDTTGARPNALMYSEVDEPESVPADNELVIQENTSEPDKLVALIPLGSMLLLLQTAHMYRLTYVAQPVIDAAITLSGYRGVLNNRCWDVLAGVAYIVDSNGMYAYDGQQEDAVSLPIDNMWRDRLIDFANADRFHVRADAGSKTVRFYYSRVGDITGGATAETTVGKRALCYCTATKAWWEETYPAAITATCRLPVQNATQNLLATAPGSICKPQSGADAGYSQTPSFTGSTVSIPTGSANIPLSIRTGAMPLSDKDGNRSITLLYTPTSANWDLTLSLVYNNSANARPSAISSDRGSGFTTTEGAGAVLNLNAARSALGTASGVATAYYSGRGDPRSAGADKHLALVMASTGGSQKPVIHNVAIEGVG